MYLGESNLEISEDEKIYRANVKKAFVASKDIDKNNRILKNDIEMLRSPKKGVSNLNTAKYKCN